MISLLVKCFCDFVDNCYHKCIIGGYLCKFIPLAIIRKFKRNCATLFAVDYQKVRAKLSRAEYQSDLNTTEVESAGSGGDEPRKSRRLQCATRHNRYYYNMVNPCVAIKARSRCRCCR